MPNESRLHFSSEELLENPKYDRTLIVNDRRCHGGFDKDGNYQSPRTIWRNPAVKAWQEQHLATSRLPLVEVPRDVVPPYTPNVAQARFLLKNGVREPVIRILTEIAIVEGFGAFIRELPVPALKSFIREDVAGTALAHLTGGLFEAHARDEAGWDAEGGHKQMWEAARDAALSNPIISPEIFAAIMGRRSATPPQALFPALGEPVERLIRFMVDVLAIEVFAASTFAWAEEVLSDPEISDAPEAAANLVRYIRSDEAPHVEYLRTGLSEIGARTLLTQDGKEIAGGVVVDALMKRTLTNMMRQRAVDRPAMLRDLIRNNAQGKDAESLLAEFESLGTSWEAPARFAPKTNAVAANVSY
jgi:hypothetical protein